MDVPTVQEKSEQIFFVQFKAHQYKLETNMTVCHLHYAKSEEHNNDDDMNSSDCENSYVTPCVFVPD